VTEHHEVKSEPRIMRAVDFVAESLENEANKMPPGYKEQADALRRLAKTMREREEPNPKMVRVWEAQAT
jgi:hypothetical protein